jgi:hypothetical protein
MRHIKKPHAQWFEFDDCLAFWDACDRPEIEDIGGRSSRDTDDPVFFGTKTWEEARMLARYGWREGTKQVKSIASVIGNKIGSRIEREHMVHDVTGEFPDVAAHIAGLPESMIHMHRAIDNGRGRIVRLVYNQSAIGDVKSAVIMRRGAVACALIDAISQAGYAVEVTFCKWTEGEPDIGVTFPLKRSDEPLNMERLAFCLANPAMQRRMVFSFWETLPTEIRRKYSFSRRGGYGRSCDAPEDMRGDIYFGRMYGDEEAWRSPENAEKAAIRMLEEAGIIESDRAKVKQEA